MHVKRTIRKRGDKTYTYLSLVETVRRDGKVTHDTLLRLGEVGELERTGQLDRIIAALRAHTERRWLAVDEVEGNGAPSFGSIAAIRSYFMRLELDQLFSLIGKARGSKHLEDTVFAMVANRLVDPSSKRRTITEWLSAVSLPVDVAVPQLDQCYRAVDALAEAKESTEAHLYERLCDLTNLDLRLVCYDLTSTYFEAQAASESFPSRRYGYSRDKREDRPQVVIGLLVTSDGIPISHHVFAGNTNDASTLAHVMADLQTRFGVGKIALVADRGLISEQNLTQVHDAGFDHVLATRLHRDDEVAHVLEKAAVSNKWVDVASTDLVACDLTVHDQRFVVVFSEQRKARDDKRREELMARVEDKLIALDRRVSAGQLTNPAKIGVAADRILRDSGVSRCFVTTIRKGLFSWDYDQDALRYEEDLLAGRYVLTTSLRPDQASTSDVVRHYRTLINVEKRFRVMKDFLALRPVYHWTEKRVRGHIALCVVAAVIEAVMAKDLQNNRVGDPDVADQTMTPRRALAELAKIRHHRLATADNRVDLIDRPNSLQRQVLTAFGVDTSDWNRAGIG